MKVLYLGHDDSTGYSYAARNNVLALDAAGVDVVFRPIRLNDITPEPHERLRELTAKSSAGCDVQISHTLPSLMRYDGHFRKNIGLFAYETRGKWRSDWVDSLNLMDEVWAVCVNQKLGCLQNGVKVPVKLAPHSTDVSRFTRTYPDYPGLMGLKRAGVFLFYTAGEFVARKNYVGLLRAFHHAFGVEDNVRLVIKTSVPGKSPAEAKEVVKDFCKGVKAKIGLRESSEEIIITDRLDDEGLLSLHQTCDAFVQLSHAECWSLPAMDAMGMGKTPIVPRWGGYRDYMSDDEGWMVDAADEPCFGSDSPGLYSSREIWASPDVLHAARCMREAYEDKELRRELARNGRERIFSFSHQQIGQILKRNLAD